jgi:hypothetical protein
MGLDPRLPEVRADEGRRRLPPRLRLGREGLGLGAFLDLLSRLSPRWLLLAAGGSVALLGVADYLTGPLLSFAFFYLVPVLAVAWLLGRREATLVAAAAAVAWVLAAILNPEGSPRSPIAFWNGAVLLGVLLVVVEVVGGLRAHLITEGELLGDVQQRLLPTVLPSVAGCSIAAAWRPAGAVGGDYYDVLPDDGGAALCIGDVSGKGVPAALLMSNLQAAVRALASEPLPPASLCARLNRVMFRNMLLGSYVTFFFCRLDPVRGRLVYTCAGHNPPLLMRGDGSCLRLATGGPVLGVFPDVRFAEEEVEVLPGDTLVLYTDGVTEQCDTRGAELGEERLQAVLRAARRLSASAVVERIVTAVETFGQGPLQDDFTLLVVSLGGAEDGADIAPAGAPGWPLVAGGTAAPRPGAGGWTGPTR